VDDRRCIHTPPGCWVCGLWPVRRECGATKSSLGHAFHRFPRRFKKIEDCEFVSLSMARPPREGLQARSLVHLRPRFHGFAAMSTVGDFKSPFYFQNPDAEWTAARPFVIAFRHTLRITSERRKSLPPSRRETRNPAIPVCADQEFFQVRIPFVVGQFRTAREAGGSAESGSRPRILGLFPPLKFTPIKHVPPGS